MIRRRWLLHTGWMTAAALCVSPPAWAFGDAALVGIAELDLGPGTVQRPAAWQRLLYEVRLTTSVEVQATVPTVTLNDEALFEHPFVVLQADSGFALPEGDALERLSRYLSYGGFLLVDDVSGGTDKNVDRAVQALMKRLFPTRALAQVPVDHAVNRTFFLIRRAPGRVDRSPAMSAMAVGTFNPVMVHPNDLGGALLRDASGRFPNACVPGGEAQRREALKVGINLVMYSLTANYKKDQAHVRQLMKEGRLE